MRTGAQRLTCSLQAVGTHFLGVLFFSGLYLGWAAIGKVLTGWSAFGWLDKDVVGSTEAVTAYSIGFLALAPLSEWHDSLGDRDTYAD